MSGARRSPTYPHTPSESTTSPVIRTPADDSGDSLADSDEYDSDADSNFRDGGEGEAAIPLKRFKTGKHGYRLDAQPSPAGPRVRWSNDGGTPLPDHVRAAARQSSNVGSEFFWSQETERRIVRRMDLYLVGFMAVLYTLGFLDRSNIGNARLAGLERDLHLSPAQWEWTLTAFYLSYISFEWATLLWRIFRPHKYVSICVGVWGLAACFQALSTSFSMIVVLRFLLGAAEAAFSPGVPFYLSFFYQPHELAFRVGLFIAAAPLATAYAGGLAWLITSIPGPIRPWRTLFIVEGFPTLVMAVVSWYWVPDGPDDCWWLGWEERKIARRRLIIVRDADNEEELEEEEEPRTGLHWPDIWRSLVDGKNWIMALMFFCCNVAFASLPIFMPTIIHTYGYSRATSQALSAPPYLVSFFSILITTHLSDRFRSRAPFLVGHAMIASASYALLSAPLPNTAKYILLYPLTSALFSCISLLIPWMLNTSKSASSKGAGMVLLNVVGQCGPLLGTRLYPESSAPGYEWGMQVCSGSLGFVAVGAVLVRVIMKGRGGME